MASNLEATDINSELDYQKSLKELMQSCLPAILVEIVDLRPNDPVQYLAHALYRFRGKEDLIHNQLLNRTILQDETHQTNQRSASDINVASNLVNSASNRLDPSASHVDPSSHGLNPGYKHMTPVKPLIVDSRRRVVNIIQNEDDPHVQDIDSYRTMEEMGNLTLTMLHQAEQTAIQAIGDIFDDNDIT